MAGPPSLPGAKGGRVPLGAEGVGACVLQQKKTKKNKRHLHWASGIIDIQSQSIIYPIRFEHCVSFDLAVNNL